MLTNDYILRSPPVEFRWAGWRASGIDLQKAGWSIAVERNDYNCSFLFAVYHEGLNVKGISNHIDERLVRSRQRDLRHLGPIPVQLKIATNIDMVGEVKFTTVDMMPTWEEERGFHPIESFFNVIKPTPLDKQIILDELSMKEVLGLALDKQKPIQERIRKEMIRRKRIEEMMREGQLPSTKKAELRLIA